MFNIWNQIKVGNYHCNEKTRASKCSFHTNEFISMRHNLNQTLHIIAYVQLTFILNFVKVYGVYRSMGVKTLLSFFHDPQLTFFGKIEYLDTHTQ